MSTLRSIVKTEGTKALLRGISATYYGGVLYGLIYFSIYKAVKHSMKEFFEEINALPVCFLLSALISEGIALTFYYPFELIKARLQTMN